MSRICSNLQKLQKFVESHIDIKNKISYSITPKRRQRETLDTHGLILSPNVQFEITCQGSRKKRYFFSGWPLRPYPPPSNLVAIDTFFSLKIAENGFRQQQHQKLLASLIHIPLLEIDIRIVLGISTVDNLTCLVLLLDNLQFCPC